MPATARWWRSRTTPAPPFLSRRWAPASCAWRGTRAGALRARGGAPAAGLRDPLPPVPQRRHHAARTAPGPAPVGVPGRRLDRRGRLRERVPLRGPPAGGAPVAGPRRAGDLYGVLLEDP